MSADHVPAAVPTAVVADRAVGVVLASAAGDALGAGYEFGPPMADDAPVAMKGGGAFGWEPGEWTDDTQMALGVLGVLADGRTDLDEVESAFRDWYASGPADVGSQTRAVLSSQGRLADAAARFAERHPRSAGNGSLMRTAPVALAHPGDPVAIADLAHQVSALTHADDDCVDACVLWSVTIDLTVHHAPDATEPWDWTAPLHAALAQLPRSRRGRWAELIDEAAGAPPTAFPRNGWVVHAFQAAIAAITSTPVPDGVAPGRHLVDALETAVRAGGDTDTVAAIAGGLLGARWGGTAVPLAWRRALHGRAAHPGARLDAGDLDRLARLAALGGRPGQDGWPGCPSMYGHYRRRFPSRPVEAELGGVAFGNVAALPAVLEAGVDTVVSLCRMGTADVPAGVEHHVLGLVDSDRGENPNLVLLLADTADALHQMVSEGRRVFVHCVAAENRTPAAAAALLHRHHGHTATEALAMASGALNEPKAFLQEAVHLLSGLPVVDIGVRAP